MIRVLHELANLDGGGVARLLVDYYSCMDRDRIHFDFLITDEYSDGILEQPVKDMGCKVFKAPGLKKDARGRLRMMEEIIRDGNYDVVHSHISARSCVILGVAKRCGVKKRFAHSHIAAETVSRAKHLVDQAFIARTKRIATDLLSCGRDAGVYRWGRRHVDSGRVHVMRNAVDTQRFTFDAAAREDVRRELGAGDRKVIGLVGRLNHQKNHDFLLDVFAAVEKKRPGEFLLALVGRGPLEDALKAKAKALEIADSVLFLGVRSDVPRLLNGFDVFALPSFYEGLPVVLVEAQVNGVTEVVSDAVTKEMEVTDLISYLPLSAGADAWADRLIAAAQETHDRGGYARQVAEAGYDIRLEAGKMQDFYSK